MNPRRNRAIPGPRKASAPAAAQAARPAGSAKRLGHHQRSFYVGNPDVENDVGLIEFAATDAARNAAGLGVDKAIIGRLGDCIGDRIGGVEMPAEQLAIIVAEFVWAFA